MCEYGEDHQPEPGMNWQRQKPANKGEQEKSEVEHSTSELIPQLGDFGFCLIFWQGSCKSNLIGAVAVTSGRQLNLAAELKKIRTLGFGFEM